MPTLARDPTSRSPTVRANDPHQRPLVASRMEGQATSLGRRTDGASVAAPRRSRASRRPCRAHERAPRPRAAWPQHGEGRVSALPAAGCRGWGAPGHNLNTTDKAQATHRPSGYSRPSRAVPSGRGAYRRTASKGGRAREYAGGVGGLGHVRSVLRVRAFGDVSGRRVAQVGVASSSFWSRWVRWVGRSWPWSSSWRASITRGSNCRPLWLKISCRAAWRDQASL